MKDREIIEAEIKRLETAWENAQERYAFTGSRTTDKTMAKYRVLIEALENSISDNRVNALERSVIESTEKLARVRETIVSLAQAGRIPADAANLLTNIIMRGGEHCA